MDLDYRHPLYEANINDWHFFNASYVGGTQYRSPSLGMLRKYLFEDDAPGNQYSNRLEYTAMDNLVKLTVDTYRSYLFKTTPVRTFGNLQDDIIIQRFLNDVDFDGQDLNDFMKQANDMATVYGQVWLLVTKGSSEGVITREQEIEADIRPYARIFTPENVCDWEYTKMPNGAERLTYVKTKEWAGENLTRYIVWTEEEFYTYLLDTETDTVIEKETTINPIGRVPFVCLRANPSNYKGIGYSDVADVAKTQQAIFNLLSEAEQGIRISNHPTLVKTESTSAQAGAGAVINMDEATDPALKPYLIEPDGTNIQSIRDMIEVHVQSFLRSTHLGAVMAERGFSAKSGIALQTEFEMLNTRLGDKAAKMEQAEWAIWSLFWSWSGLEADEDFNVEYQKSFDLRDEHADVALYSKALALGIESDTYKKQLYKQIAKVVIEDGDALDDIFKEIDEMSSTPEFGTNLDDGTNT
jgi:hypothetical protein